MLSPHPWYMPHLPTNTIPEYPHMASEVKENRLPTLPNCKWHFRKNKIKLSKYSLVLNLMTMTWMYWTRDFGNTVSQERIWRIQGTFFIWVQEHPIKQVCMWLLYFSQVKACEFNQITDSLMWDTIANDQVSGILLRKPVLTLARPIDICRSSEMSQS